MSRLYRPGRKADAIVKQQLAKGVYTSADEVVRVGLMLLQQSETEIAELQRTIEEASAGDSAEGGDTDPPRRR
jgi:putative addiction module CopG family antidote